MQERIVCEMVLLEEPCFLPFQDEFVAQGDVDESAYQR